MLYYLDITEMVNKLASIIQLSTRFLQVMSTNIDWIIFIANSKLTEHVVKDMKNIYMMIPLSLARQIQYIS